MVEARAEPPICPAIWLPSWPPDAMPNRAICVRLLAEPNGSTGAWIC
jgi:hypothetical protein